MGPDQLDLKVFKVGLVTVVLSHNCGVGRNRALRLLDKDSPMHEPSHLELGLFSRRSDKLPLDHKRPTYWEGMYVWLHSRDKSCIK